MKDGTVKFNYVGSATSEKALKIVDLVNERKSYELKLKQVKSDLKEIGKVIKGAPRKNVLDSYVIVRGWCQYYYRILFDDAPEIPLIRTTDIDFLVPNPSSFKNKVDLTFISLSKGDW